MAQETGKLVSWKKKEGESVRKGELLLEVETDKAVVEIEAGSDGILGGITAHEGAVVPVGQTIAWLLKPGEAPPASTGPVQTGRTGAAALQQPVMAPESAAGPPASELIGCAVRSAISSSPPGRMWSSRAISLHIVPLGRNTAASCPSSSATRSSSARVVGSWPRCSSPTSAAAIASRIPRVGRVCVSL